MLFLRVSAALAVAIVLGPSAAHPTQQPELQRRQDTQEEPCRFLRDSVQAWFEDNNIGFPPLVRELGRKHKTDLVQYPKTPQAFRPA